MPVVYTEVSSYNHVCILTPRVQSSLYDLMKRRTLPTCQLKFSVEAAILNIDKKVQTLRKHQEELELKVDQIVNLLRKPQNGKKNSGSFALLLLIQVIAFTTVQRTNAMICTIYYSHD